MAGTYLVHPNRGASPERLVYGQLTRLSPRCVRVWLRETSANVLLKPMGPNQIMGGQRIQLRLMLCCKERKRAVAPSYSALPLYTCTLREHLHFSATWGVLINYSSDSQPFVSKSTCLVSDLQNKVPWQRDGYGRSLTPPCQVRRRRRRVQAWGRVDQS